MISDRQYRQSLGKERAISELNEYAGRQFDPRVVKEFIDMITELEEREAEKTEDSVDEETARMGDQWI